MAFQRALAGARSRVPDLDASVIAAGRKKAVGRKGHGIDRSATKSLKKWCSFYLLYEYKDICRYQSLGPWTGLLALRLSPMLFKLSLAGAGSRVPQPDRLVLAAGRK